MRKRLGGMRGWARSLGNRPALRRGGWLLALLLAVMAGCLGAPKRADANIVCTSTGASITFTSGSTTGTGSIAYNCQSNDLLGETFTLCSALGTPTSGSIAAPNIVSGAYQIPFSLYTDSGVSTPWTGSNFVTRVLSFPTVSLGVTTLSGTMNFYGVIAGIPNVPAGTYTVNFPATVIGAKVSNSCLQNATASLLGLVALSSFTGPTVSLAASTSVANSSAVTSPSALTLGPVNSAATGTWGSTGIAITCTLGANYYVGLLPSNNNTAGLGSLTGTGSNTDHPAYQLRSTSSTGPIWGNTATASSMGNGVAGSGTGLSQPLTVYATVPSANYTPDNYSDTVTVNVNY